MDAGDIMDTDEEDVEDEGEDDEGEDEDDGERVLDQVSSEEWRARLTAEVSGLEVNMDHDYSQASRTDSK